MNIGKLPLASLSLTFVTGCGADTSVMEGLWEGVSATYDGEDYTDEMIYSYTEDGCTYSKRLFMILNKDASGGLFAQYEYQCNDGESESYGQGFYLNFEYVAGKWVSTMGYYEMSCLAPKGGELECEYGSDYVFRFRKES